LFIVFRVFSILVCAISLLCSVVIHCLLRWGKIEYIVQRTPLEEVASFCNVIASILTLPSFIMVMQIQDCSIAQVNISTRMVLAHSDFVPFGRLCGKSDDSLIGKLSA
jgi:hypothetical protein